MTATVLTAAGLTDTHPELPEGFRRPMGELLAQGWPHGFYCGACEKPGFLSYRCSRCGKDIAGVER